MHWICSGKRNHPCDPRRSRAARPARRNAGRVGEREYRLVVEGELSDRAGRAFEGMTLTREHGRTVLIGRVRDQSELQGLLQRVSDLGLTLVAATTTDEGLAQSGRPRSRSHG